MARPRLSLLIISFFNVVLVIKRDSQETSKDTFYLELLST